MVLAYISHESPYIQREAAKVVYLMSDPKFIKQAPRISALLNETKESEARVYLLKALGEIGDSRQVEAIVRAEVHFRPNERRAAEEAIKRMGLKNVPLLISLLKDTELPDRARLAAGKVLGSLALAQLRAHLESVLQPEIERAIFFLKALAVSKKDPGLRVLTHTLLSDYRSVLDFIIQLLGVAGEVEDTELLSRSFRSGKAKIESQAIETLEKTCEPAVFRSLRPLFENENALSSDEVSLDHILDTLRNSCSIANKIVAFTLMKQMQKPGWQTELKKEMTSSSELFKHLAYELLEKA
jgi:HEAT repeat protein